MSSSRRNFSAEFKTNLVLQLLKGEKELNVLAVENDIQPNLLRNWKKEFLTTTDPLPKNTYEVEGMQAEGNSLYYCLAPTDATDGSKFPQYIVLVDR